MSGVPLNADDARKQSTEHSIAQILEHIRINVEGGRFSCTVSGYVPSVVRKHFVERGFRVRKEPGDKLHISW